MNSNASTHPVTTGEIIETTAIVPETLTLSAAEAAAILGVSRATIYRMIARRVFVPMPGLRHKRLPKKQVLGLARRGNSARLF